jgi:F0F1-type ATP synthase assembly protein I
MGEDKQSSGYSKAAAYMGLAFVTPVSGWVCYKLGQWLDVKTGSNYWALIGMILGCAAGMYETFRQAVRLEGLDRKKD